MYDGYYKNILAAKEKIHMYRYIFQDETREVSNRLIRLKPAFQEENFEKLLARHANLLTSSVSAYLTVEEAAPYEIKLRNVFKDSQDNPILDGEYLITITGQYSEQGLEDVKIYASPTAETQHSIQQRCTGESVFSTLDRVTNHPNFVAGRPVVFAGFFEFSQGALTWISNNSGHYKPSLEEILPAITHIVQCLNLEVMYLKICDATCKNGEYDAYYMELNEHNTCQIKFLNANRMLPSKVLEGYEEEYGETVEENSTSRFAAPRPAVFTATPTRGDLGKSIESASDWYSGDPTGDPAALRVSCRSVNLAGCLFAGGGRAMLNGTSVPGNEENQALKSPGREKFVKQEREKHECSQLAVGSRSIE